MSTVIDSLVVELGLDNLGFKKGVKDSEKVQEDFAEKTNTLDKKQTDAHRKTDREKEVLHKNQLHRNKEILEGMLKMRNQLAGLLILFTGGKEIVDFVGDTIRATVSLGHMSDNVGISVNRLAGWGVAMKEVGGTAEEAAAMIDKASMAAVSGSKGSLIPPSESKLGLMKLAALTGTDLYGAFTNAESMLEAQAKVVQKMYATMPPAQAFAMSREILKLSTNEIDLLKKKDVLQRVQHGSAISGQNNKKAKQAEDALQRYTDIAEKLAKVGRGILSDVLEAFSKWYDTHGKEVDTFIKDFVKGIESITPNSLEKVNTTLETTAAVLNGILATLKFIHDLGSGMGIVAGEVQQGDYSHIATGQSMVDTLFDRNFKHKGESGQSGNTTLTVIVPPGTPKEKIQITQTGSKVDTNIVHQSQ